MFETIYKAPLETLEGGQTFQDFSRDLKPLLVDKGWRGRALETDLLTGEQTLVQLGSMRRLRLFSCLSKCSDRLTGSNVY